MVVEASKVRWKMVAEAYKYEAFHVWSWYRESRGFRE